MPFHFSTRVVRFRKHRSRESIKNPSHAYEKRSEPFCAPWWYVEDVGIKARLAPYYVTRKSSDRRCQTSFLILKHITKASFDTCSTDRDLRPSQTCRDIRNKGGQCLAVWWKIGDGRSWSKSSCARFEIYSIKTDRFAASRRCSRV